jgi:hypothetical protein
MLGAPEFTAACDPTPASEAIRRLVEVGLKAKGK